jgi:hypothetical protein
MLAEVRIHSIDPNNAMRIIVRCLHNDKLYSILPSAIIRSNFGIALVKIDDLIDEV